MTAFRFFDAWAALADGERVPPGPAKAANPAKVEAAPATGASPATFATFATFAKKAGAVANATNCVIPDPGPAQGTQASTACLGNRGGTAANYVKVANPAEPVSWREGFARLNTDKPPAALGLSPQRWRAIHGAIGAFLDEWEAEAAQLGWTAHELFGADAKRPEVTWLNSGPLWSSEGARVIELHADRIVFRASTGVHQTAPRRPPLRPRVLPWELPL